MCVWPRQNPLSIQCQPTPTQAYNTWVSETGLARRPALVVCVCVFVRVCRICAALYMGSLMWGGGEPGSLKTSKRKDMEFCEEKEEKNKKKKKKKKLGELGKRQLDIRIGLLNGFRA